MFEPTESEVDKDVHKSMEMFERAMVEGSVELSPITPRKLLVALDGSSQDEMSLLIAERLVGRFSVEVAVVDARDAEGETAEIAEVAAERLSGRALAPSDGEAYEKILKAIGDSACNLAIVPCPFGRDIEKVGSDSTGTVIDVLLARSTVPVLVTRQTYDVAEVPFERVILAFSGENEAAPLAAGWATGLASPGGDLQLMLVVEEEAVENLKALMVTMQGQAEFDTGEFSEALQKSFIPLHRGLQAQAHTLGLRYHLDVKQEGHVPLRELTSDQRHPLLVLGLERSDHGSQGNVHDRLRSSANAVLIVPFGQSKP